MAGAGVCRGRAWWAVWSGAAGSWAWVLFCYGLPVWYVGEVVGNECKGFSGYVRMSDILGKTWAELSWGTYYSRVPFQT